MKRQWLWLEDQQETVADFRHQVESKVSISLFRRPNDLMLELVRRQREGLLEVEPLGLLLDVMLINHPSIAVPGVWHGGEKISYFTTQRNGYDAGVVFYEKVILRHPSMESPPLLPPPPVIFLTVVQQNFQGLEGRLEGIRAKWASEHGIDPSRAQVAWFQKWNAQGVKLVDMIAKWEADS